MKKSISLLILATFAGAVTQAHDFEVINSNTNPVDAIYKLEGDTPFSFGKGKTVELTIDFGQSEIVEFDRDFRTVINDMGTLEKYNSDHGQNFVDDWDGNLKKMTETACKYLKNALGAAFVPAGSGAQPDYRLVVRIGQFEFGHFVAIGGAKDGGTVTKGLAEVYDADNNLIAVYDINYLRGMNVGYGNNDRIREWGKFFAKEFKKVL